MEEDCFVDGDWWTEDLAGTYIRPAVCSCRQSKMGYVTADRRACA
jgi:hypothetical protein